MKPLDVGTHEDDTDDECNGGVPQVRVRSSGFGLGIGLGNSHMSGLRLRSGLGLGLGKGEVHLLDDRVGQVAVVANPQEEEQNTWG